MNYLRYEVSYIYQQIISQSISLFYNLIRNKTNNLKAETPKATDATNDANAKIKKVSAKSKIKKSKKLKITVTLNKKVKGKYVYIIFNGKTYKAKTNANGIAKITIKKSVLKKALGKTKSKKVKYQIISGNSIKNKSVKITK